MQKDLVLDYISCKTWFFHSWNLKFTGNCISYNKVHIIKHAGYIFYKMKTNVK